MYEKYIYAFLTAFSAGCATVPKGLVPVNGFEVQRYLGTWHEIARLDHPFERGLVSVTAEYSLRQDGGVKVVNRGYKTSIGKWKEVEGRAYFVGDSVVGQLKISFFRPFYGGYNIIELDRKGYSYALVAGPSKAYLWILARSPELSPQIMRRLVDRAKELGFNTEKLIFPGVAQQVK